MVNTRTIRTLGVVALVAAIACGGLDAGPVVGAADTPGYSALDNACRIARRGRWAKGFVGAAFAGYAHGSFF